MKTLRRLSLALVFAAVAMTGIDQLGAKATRLASWEFDRVWPTSVRFLRLDEGFAIVEKDAETGYVVFEVQRDEKTYRGSLELVRTKDYANRDAVRLILRIAELPIYKEDGVLDRLLIKLAEELGQPVDPPPEKKKPEKKKPEKKPKDGDKGEAKSS